MSHTPEELFITGRRIVPGKSRILYDRPFTPASLAADFEAASGSWQADETGWLTGEIRRNGGGILYSRASYEGDMMLDFDAMAVPPCQNDLNFVWKTCGWNYEKNDADRGYIGGLGGWWLNRAGIEKYPSCTPFVSTGLCPLEAGKQYHITAGSIRGHCFLFVDGALVVEMRDPTPEALADCGRFGLGTYASCIRFTALTVYEPYAEPLHLSYPVNA